jgi:hypothetical protein
MIDMDLMEAIWERHSVRQYTDRKIEKYKREILEKEIENKIPPELDDRQYYDTPIGPVCMSKSEHEAYLEELKNRKDSERGL